MITSANWFATGASLMVLIEIWIKIEALTVLAKGARLPFLSRLAFSITTALICFFALKVSTLLVGAIWGVVVLWLVEHAMLFVYAWNFTPAVRTYAFWKELVEVRIPQWFASAHELLPKFGDKVFWQEKWCHLRQKIHVATTNNYYRGFVWHKIRYSVFSACQTIFGHCKRWSATARQYATEIIG